LIGVAGDAEHIVVGPHLRCDSLMTLEPIRDDFV
jgi:hypothetical protein